jgi:hypothetical protein
MLHHICKAVLHISHSIISMSNDDTSQEEQDRILQDLQTQKFMLNDSGAWFTTK